jgi:hypothetical protein
MVTEQNSVKTFLLSRLLERVQHEDNLLVQRTLTFLTAAGLLITSLGFSWTTTGAWLKYAIVGLGISFSLVQIVLGTVANSAISFWRHYIRKAETDLDIVIDSALYDYYQIGAVKTRVGDINVLKSANDSRRRPSWLKWIRKFVPSTNTVVAIYFPLMIFLFWLSLLTSLLWPLTLLSLSGLLFVALLIIVVPIGAARILPVVPELPASEFQRT